MSESIANVEVEETPAPKVEVKKRLYVKLDSPLARLLISSGLDSDVEFVD